MTTTLSFMRSIENERLLTQGEQDTHLKEQAKTIFEEIICPMCYRLNPHHAIQDNGIGCKSCKEKEDWCGSQGRIS